MCEYVDVCVDPETFCKPVYFFYPGVPKVTESDSGTRSDDGTRFPLSRGCARSERMSEVGVKW